MHPLKARNGAAPGCPVASPEAQGHSQSPGPWGEQCPAQPGHSASRGMFWQGNNPLCPWVSPVPPGELLARFPLGIALTSFFYHLPHFIFLSSSV